MKNKTQYSHYKDSGIEWLRQVPEHWEIVKAKRLFTERSEKGYPDEPLLASTQSGGVIPKSLYEYTTVLPTKDLHTLKLVKAGDFVISLRSFQGGIEYSNYQGIISPAYTILQPKPIIFHDYYRYLLKSKHYISGLALLVTGIREGQNIDTGKFKNSYLPLPPFEEQQIISSFLDLKLAIIDKFVSKKKKLIEHLLEQKVALINQVITNGLNPDVPVKDSGINWLGDIPKHWSVFKLKYLGEMINGYAFDSNSFTNSGVKVLKITNIQPLYIDWTDTSYVDEYLYEQLPNFRLYKGDLVFALTRPVIKAGIKAAFIDTDEKILINQRNAVLRVTKKITSKTWLFNVIISNDFVKRFEQEIDFTNQQPNISSYDIGNIEVPIPPLEEQNEINIHISEATVNINNAIAKIEKEIAFTEEYRTALISEVITGKIDVRDYALEDKLKSVEA